MKVLFLITVKSHGRGGHVHSLNHIASSLGNLIDVGIISIGTKESDLISRNPHFLKHVYFTGKNILSFRKEIENELSKFEPAVLHFFDVASYNILTFVLPLRTYSIVVSKCGGPNPVEFPYVQNLILFSKENMRWFLKENKFKSTSIHLIPNRVSRNELASMPNENYCKDVDVFSFIRIARIGLTYEKSLLASIRLIEKLVMSGERSVHLYIIGTVESPDVLEILRKKSSNLPITFLTDNQYTEKASDMLYLGDAVIATGRGIMEATALAKPVLTPAKNAEVPILVNRENFESFLDTNFSERNTANQRDLDINFERIRRLIREKDYFDHACSESSDFFDAFFDVNGGVGKYIDVYNDAIESKEFKYNKLVNLKYQLKTIYNFLR